MRKLTKSVVYFTTRNHTTRRETTKRIDSGKSGKDREKKLEKRQNLTNPKKFRIKFETKIFNGMRMEEADMKIFFLVYLKLGVRGKRIFEQMIPKVESPSDKLRYFLGLIKRSFIRKLNVIYERHKPLNRRQRDRENWEHF